MNTQTIKPSAPHINAAGQDSHNSLLVALADLNTALRAAWVKLGEPGPLPIMAITWDKEGNYTLSRNGAEYENTYSARGVHRLLDLMAFHLRP